MSWSVYVREGSVWHLVCRGAGESWGGRVLSLCPCSASPPPPAGGGVGFHVLQTSPDRGGRRRGALSRKGVPTGEQSPGEEADDKEEAARSPRQPKGGKFEAKMLSDC